MEQSHTRQDYRVFYPIVTRWMDNDIYGHVNNVQYYSYFDSVINRYLIEVGGLDIHQGEVVGYVVNSGCSYSSPVGYPDRLEIGLRVERIGKSSVKYGLGLFREGDDQAAAQGHVVHVFVDRKANAPVAVPARLRQVLEEIRG